MPNRTKNALMKKAKASGLTLSSVLNMAANAYVNDRLFIGAFERDLAEARTDVKAGRVYSLDAVEHYFAKRDSKNKA